MALSNPETRQGHVYILTSPACEHIKIGGTDFAPLRRIKEINSGEPYKSLGPWSLHDFRQVADWRKVEHFLHYACRSKLVKSIDGQKELFALSASDASRQLELIDESQILRKPKIDRMFQDQDFSRFLGELFRLSGLMNWINLQGAWTFSLFPSTSGGRFFTLNIGTHEVAFATNPPKHYPSIFFFTMDSLIHDVKGVARWVTARNGALEDDLYPSGLHRSTSVHFVGGFDVATEFLHLQGVRRAILAYWGEALIKLQESGRLTMFSRHHNWNAVAEIKKRIEHNTI
jgi:hypothetical protein